LSEGEVILVEIKVLGTGCAKCKQLEKDVFNVLAEMDLAADVEKVQDIKKIMSYKVMSTPALVVNGKVKVAGRVPRADELKKLITEEWQEEGGNGHG
jgi:small redox-active disulfide protein 2